MSELRLVPSAAVVWLASLLVLTAGPRAAALLIAAAAGAALVLRAPGQAVLTAALGAASATVAVLRMRLAAGLECRSIAGRVTEHPRHLDSGTWLLRVAVEGKPSAVAVFAEELPAGIALGAVVSTAGRCTEAAVAGVHRQALSGIVELVGPPSGYAAFAQHVRDTFAAAVAARVGPGSAGLIPGMVLGDTRAQSFADEQAYIDTGLSHLSAVSGSNVAIVTTAAVVAATLLGLGLRVRLAAAAAALLLFAALVGPEPSVLRASVTGLVGLVAVFTSSRAEPTHALCLAVIGLVLVDTDLAVHFGFALSVAATAGIVALAPLLHRVLAVTGWPDIVVRALAVAIAADAVTMPIVAAMAGRVSVVAAAANVLVAPVTAPVTVLGLIAAALSLAPGGLEAPLLLVTEPLTWWVHTVATVGAGLPVATVAVGPATALVAYGWVVAGLLAGRPRVTAAVAVGVVAATQWPLPPPEINPATARAHVVATRAEIDPVPPGTELVVVLETGRPPPRPAVTTEGIPVIFPSRTP